MALCEQHRGNSAQSPTAAAETAAGPAVYPTGRTTCIYDTSNGSHYDHDRDYGWNQYDWKQYHDVIFT
jgi:hypothetical protein